MGGLDWLGISSASGTERRGEEDVHPIHERQGMQGSRRVTRTSRSTGALKAAQETLKQTNIANEQGKAKCRGGACGNGRREPRQRPLKDEPMVSAARSARCGCKRKQYMYRFCLRTEVVGTGCGSVNGGSAKRRCWTPDAPHKND